MLLFYKDSKNQTNSFPLFFWKYDKRTEMWVHKEVTLPLIEEAESIEVEIYELKKKDF